ncbi:DUF998 domain-containing protein [Nocardia brasiliensis]|uniref:DUF998 domain-containing protein n=1 Tax=Nocardia brasiliensis TaxID=37326 RepID=UPI000AD12671|nr:DUF998 domain-containing protein [Nocardia brasiliensis]
MRRRKAGAALLILTASYYVVQAVVAARWAEPGYGWAGNMISDLGVPECLGDMGQYGLVPSRYICSPWHAVMSAEFVLLGVLVLGAALCLTPLLPKNLLGWAVPLLALVNCVAIMLVGLFPGSADEVPGGSRARAVLHPTGAIVELVTGLAIMIIIAWLYRRHRGFALATVALIVVTVFGMVASLATDHLGLGAGAAERLAIDPFVLWRILTGVVVLAALPRISQRTDGS